MKKPTTSARKATTSRANGRLGGRPRTSASRVYTYQWPDGDMSLIIAADDQEALMAIDEIGNDLPDPQRRLKAYTGGQFALVFRRNAAGRVVLRNDDHSIHADSFGELCDEFGLNVPAAIADDDERWPRLVKLQEEAEALAVKHVRDNLPPEDLAVLDQSHPSRRQTWVGTKELERELMMTLPQLKRHLKRQVRKSSEAFSIWLHGTAPSPQALAAEYRRIDAITEEQQEQGKVKLRAELAELARQEQESQS